jgi:hypothetical protein
MAVEYCNTTTDLTKAYFDIEKYKGNFELDKNEWVLHSGTIYKLPNSGFVNALFENGVRLTKVDFVGTGLTELSPDNTAASDSQTEGAASGDYTFATPSLAAITFTNDLVKTGTYCLKLTSTTNTGAGYMFADCGLQNGNTYKLSFYYFNDQAIGDEIRIGAGLNPRSYVSVAVRSGEWVKVEVIFPAYADNVANDQYLHIGFDWQSVSGILYIDDVQLELAGLDEAGEWAYDHLTDTLYVWCTGNVNPNTLTMEIGERWDDFKRSCRNIAQGKVEGFLASVLPIPFPKIAPPKEDYNSALYDPHITDIVAKMTCYEIISRLNPNDPVGMKLYKDVYNAEPEIGESKGLVNLVKDGELILKPMRSTREPGSFNVNESEANAVDVFFEVSGRYTGSLYQIWRLEIDLGGVPGTATYKLSFDGGSNWEQTGKETWSSDGDVKRVSIGSGIYVRFYGTFTIGEYIDLELFPDTDVPDVSKVGSIRMTR